ncbi:MAG: TetR/AcrR family transcriptional regulator [Halomonadaceae bacterium]|nr:MAG: TetR/AcrR family transcriptional regulator [Halomonadaceae bacterium]
MSDSVSGTPLRKPVQGRSRERVEKVVAAAEALLLERGPEDTSIPEVAARAGVPRASIYPFFPNKYALFLAIGDYHLKQVAQLIEQSSTGLDATHWQELVRGVVSVVANYYNSHPVAGLLILGGPMSRTGYLSQEVTIQDIGQRVRPVFLNLLPARPLPDSPDVITIAVEIAFACMRHSWFTHEQVTDAMAEQASMAAVSYLSNWLVE